MFIPVRYVTKNEKRGTVQGIICPHCGAITQFIKVKNTKTGSVMFIPVAKATNKTFLFCSHCGSTFDVRKKDFSKISNNADAINAIRNYRNEMTEKYGNGFSSKSFAITLVLSLFFMYGVPFFYIGKYLYGLLCLVCCMLGLTLGMTMNLFPLTGIIGMVNIVFVILLVRGKIKDGKGKYIVSKGQQEAISKNMMK